VFVLVVHVCTSWLERVNVVLVSEYVGGFGCGLRGSLTYLKCLTYQAIVAGKPNR
jgi:hypothetical protein